MSGPPGTSPHGSAVPVSGGASAFPASFTSDGETVFSGGVPRTPADCRRELDVYRKDFRGDWLEPVALALADELEAAMHAAGYLKDVAA